MTLNYDEIQELIIKYDEAIAEDKRFFKFKGELILTAYAKYLIEYLTSLNK